MAGARRKGLNQDLQNWGIGRIRAVVGNSSVVQTVRPEIDQETDCKTIGVRQPKIGDRPNFNGVWSRMGVRFWLPPGNQLRQMRDAPLVGMGDESLCRRFRVKGTGRTGRPGRLGRIPAELRAAGRFFYYILYCKCPLWPLTPLPPITIQNQALGIICPVGAGAHAHRERPFPPASGPGNALVALRLISARDGSCRYCPILANRPRSDFNAIVRVTRPYLGTHPN